jgi:hypothetical protein
MAKIFLDTNVFKYSATKQLRMRPRLQELDWGHTKTTVVVHDLVYVNQLDHLRADSRELRTEADLLPEVAALATREGVTFVSHMEVGLEAARLPRMDSVTGGFYGAPIECVRGGYHYGRAIYFPGIDSRKLLEDFLRGIRDSRFTEIARVLSGGARTDQASVNNLLDAFYVWIAEREKCTHFLTLERKLVEKVSMAKKLSIAVRVVRPSGLLADLREA